jgi:hypothetical protein
MAMRTHFTQGRVLPNAADKRPGAQLHPLALALIPCRIGRSPSGQSVNPIAGFLAQPDLEPARKPAARTPTNARDADATRRLAVVDRACHGKSARSQASKSSTGNAAGSPLIRRLRPGLAPAPQIGRKFQGRQSGSHQVMTAASSHQLIPPNPPMRRCLPPPTLNLATPPLTSPASGREHAEAEATKRCQRRAVILLTKCIKHGSLAG